MQHPHAGHAQGRAEPCSGRKIRPRPAGAIGLILGAILAGGRSRRFGTDKAGALLDGRALLDHIRTSLAGHVDAIVVVGRPEGVPDRPEPHLGPLGGIAGALDHAAANSFASVLTVACDMPRLPPDLIDALLRRAPSYCEDAPILGHWPAALTAPLLDHIATSPKRSVRDWARSIGALPIATTVPLANINTPEDLMAL